MSIRRFKFVSPGVFINEIDNSQLPRGPREIGPVVIGRLQKGPSNRPVTVDSMSEFVEIFGTPIAGGAASDVWSCLLYTSPSPRDQRGSGMPGWG